MGSAASLISEDWRASLRIAVHEAIPINMYHLEERHFAIGSLYESEEFATNRIHQDVFRVLGLHEWSVSQIWRHFRLMNQTATGEINLWEFREYFDLADDRSTTRLFRCFDEDRDNRLSFLEFVVGLWTYCCNCNAALVCLFFDLYDTDHNGEISLPEAEFMIQDIFGLEWESNTEARAASNWLHGREDVQIGCPELGIDEWADFMSANLSTVAEVVRMRLVLQKKVIGVGFWTHCLRKTTTIYTGRRVTVEKLLSAHVSEQVLDGLAHDRNPAMDHNDETQLALKILRRTGPFPRRRKHRELKGKRPATKGMDVKFKALTVRETFERLKVPPGEDATWEEPKSPSALQAFLASLGDLGRPGSSQEALPTASKSDLFLAKKRTHEELTSGDGPAGRSTPEALALLTVRPGLNGAPLGSPVQEEPAGTEAQGSGIDDPVIANAFHGLKHLPDHNLSSGLAGNTKSAGRSKRRTRRGRNAGKSGSTNDSNGVSFSAGRSKEALSRTGKGLIQASVVQCVGGVGPENGTTEKGALSSRLVNNISI